MSEHHLPDDHATWPEDPFALLGVNNTADKRELRRAYNRLVRVFRPDDCVEEFRKIREAYDAATRFAEWREHIGDQAVDEVESDRLGVFVIDTAAPAPEVSTRRPDSRDDSGDSTRTPPRHTTDFDACAEDVQDAADDWQTQVDAAWNLARSGDTSSAWTRLLALIDLRMDCSEAVLRLYWLLRIDAQLDQRNPRDLLLWGLSRGATNARIFELLRNEMCDDPAWAIQCDLSLAEGPSAELFWLSELLLTRWQAGLQVDDCRVVKVDIERVRDRFLFDAPEVWAGLLAQCVELFATQVAAAEPLELCRGLLSEMDNVRLDRELDRIDAVNIYLEELDSLESELEFMFDSRDVIDRVVGLLRKAPATDEQELRLDLVELVDEWMLDAARTLAQLDKLGNDSPAVFGRFQQLVRGTLCPFLFFDRGRAERLAPVILEYVSRLTGDENLRTDVLEFCGHECATVDDILEFVGKDDCPLSEPSRVELMNRLYYDRSLQCLSEAYCGFWAVSKFFSTSTASKGA